MAAGLAWRLPFSSMSMDHNDEKQRVSFHESLPQANLSGGSLVRKHPYKGSIMSMDDKDDRRHDRSLTACGVIKAGIDQEFSRLWMLASDEVKQM